MLVAASCGCRLLHRGSTLLSPGSGTPGWPVESAAAWSQLPRRRAGSRVTLSTDDAMRRPSLSGSGTATTPGGDSLDRAGSHHACSPRILSRMLHCIPPAVHPEHALRHASSQLMIHLRRPSDAIPLWQTPALRSSRRVPAEIRPWSCRASGASVGSGAA